MPEITNQEKLKCVVREIGMRKRVYPRRVDQGAMSASQAQREVAVMEAIARDYQALVAAEQPDMLGHGK